MTQLDRAGTSGESATDGSAARLSHAATSAARVTRAVDALRLAEAQLARRRQTDCGPSQTTREALRLVTNASDRGEPITPSQVAQEIGVSNSAMTPVLKRLVDSGLVEFRKSPSDARSKTIVPTDRTAADSADPLAARIRSLAERIDPEAAHDVVMFLEGVQRLVDAECRGRDA